MAYSILVSKTKFGGSALKQVLLDELFIYVAWGSPEEIFSTLAPSTEAWSAGISDDGRLLNSVGNVDVLASIFSKDGRLQVCQNAGIKCKKEFSSKVRNAIAEAGIIESAFFSSIEDDDYENVLTLRADFDLIRVEADGLSYDSTSLQTTIYDEQSGDLNVVSVGDGNSKLANVAIRLDADTLDSAMICYIADGSPVAKGNKEMDDGLYIGPRNYIIFEAEAGGDYVNFRVDQDGVEDL